MGFLMVNHVAELRGLDMAEQTLEKLVCAACLLIDYVLLLEAHVARISAVPVTQTLLDHFL